MKNSKIAGMLLIVALVLPMSSFAHKACKRWQNIVVGFANDKGDVTFNTKMKQYNRKGWKLVQVKFDKDNFTVFLARCARR